MNPRTEVFVFIDSLGWEQVKHFNFLRDILPERRSLEMQFGYSCTAIPTILTGLRPATHGHLAFYNWSPSYSPFAWTRPLARLLRPRTFWSRGRVRHQLSGIVRRVCGFTGYFQLYSIPFERLPCLDYCEKKDLFAPGGMAPFENLADNWSRQNLRWHISDWRLPERENFALADALLKRGKLDRAFIYSAAFDALQHDHVGQDDHLAAKVESYAKTVRKLHRTLQQSGRPFCLTLFSDHGMTPLKGTMDLPSALTRTGLVWGHDYALCLDSTMARFWFLRPESERLLRGVLAHSSFHGHWLSKEEWRIHGLERKDRAFGDAIYLADAGWQFVPSDMGLKPLNGMHGYDPADKDSAAAILSTEPIPPNVRRVCDLFGLMTGAAGKEGQCHSSA
ncbi:MAG: alkaline phosphatase family protein [Kiritimatiellia bacterium]